MTILPLIPDPDRAPRRCRCGRAVPVGPLVDGWGSACARDHGLTPPAALRIPRPHSWIQGGPNLFDLLRPDDTRTVGRMGGIPPVLAETFPDVAEWQHAGDGRWWGHDQQEHGRRLVVVRGDRYATHVVDEQYADDGLMNEWFDRLTSMLNQLDA